MRCITRSSSPEHIGSAAPAGTMRNRHCSRKLESAIGNQPCLPLESSKSASTMTNIATSNFSCYRLYMAEIAPEGILAETDNIEHLFEEVDLFSTALIQGGCTSGVVL
jgi:hypothetical protein